MLLSDLERGKFGKEDALWFYLSLESNLRSLDCAEYSYIPFKKERLERKFVCSQNDYWITMTDQLLLTYQ